MATTKQQVEKAITESVELRRPSVLDPRTGTEFWMMIDVLIRIPGSTSVPVYWDITSPDIGVKRMEFRSDDEWEIHIVKPRH